MGVSAGPDMIQDGLVLSLDASDRNSYPGSGTTWRDISGNNITGSLSGPTFNASNVGNFGFDGNDSIIMEENSALNTQTPSVEVWVKGNTFQNGFWFEKGQVNTQYSLFQEAERIAWRQKFVNYTTLYTTTADYISATNWAQIVGTYVSGARRLYINGTLVNSDTQTGSIETNTNGMSIGVYGGFNGSRGYYYNGNIAIVRVYNRALLPTEIFQNYNATKTRFGLK